MKTLRLFIILTFSAALAGCPAESSYNTANKTNSMPSNVMTTPPFNANPPGNVYADSQPSNSYKSASSNAGGNVQHTPQFSTPKPTPATSEKKDEGLFSFPPPKVTDAYVMDAARLLNAPGQETNLSQVSEKLLAELKKQGYGMGNYTFFWNDNDEFALVTAMERVNADGTKFPDSERWVKSAALPDAKDLREYFKYLIEGKKVYYRVFAFVVSAERKRQNFFKGTPPDFETALFWAHNPNGSDTLGGGEGSTIENVLFTEKYKCFALLYLFVNHTSLDAPRAIDPLNNDLQELTQGLSISAQEHLINTKLLEVK